MLWLSTGCEVAPTRLSNVYAGPPLRKGRTLGVSVWPQIDGLEDSKQCPARLQGDRVSWPYLPVNGSVTKGPPPNGSFVPPGVAGVHYSSPGYAASDAPELAQEPRVNTVGPPNVESAQRTLPARMAAANQRAIAKRHAAQQRTGNNGN